MVTWVAFSLANVGSHSDYQGVSVVIFVSTGCLIGAVLALGVLRRLPEPPVVAVPVALLAVGSILVFQPTYLASDRAFAMRLIVLGCTLAICVLWLHRRTLSAALSLGLAAVVMVVTAWVPITGVPRPGNDVWFLLQQSNEGLFRGENMYAMTWTGVPAGQVTDVFTYLPMSAILVAPARWLTGDVRWGLAVFTVLSAALLLVAARGGRNPDRPIAWFAPACLLALTPGHPLQIEMSWTEPIQLLLILGAVVALKNERPWASIVCLAVALASKQHVWVLLPLFIAWPPFGLRRSVWAVTGAVILCAPWIVADPRAMYADTIGSYLDSGRSDRSSTLATTLSKLGYELPSLLMLTVLAFAASYCCWRLRRRPAGPGDFCLAAALVLLVANLLNKQAYYNQWWLVGSLVLASLAFWERDSPAKDQRPMAVSDAKAPA
jgi:hypothetical protein